MEYSQQPKNAVTWSIRDTCLALLISILNFGWLLYIHFVVWGAFFTYKIRANFFLLRLKCLEEEDEEERENAHRHFSFLLSLAPSHFSFFGWYFRADEKCAPTSRICEWLKNFVPSKNLINRWQENSTIFQAEKFQRNICITYYIHLSIYFWISLVFIRAAHPLSIFLSSFSMIIAQHTQKRI